MRITRLRDPERMSTRYVLDIPDVDMVTVDLDRWDTALLEECSVPGASVADILLALQTLAFRLEQQKAKAVA